MGNTTARTLGALLAAGLALAGVPMASATDAMDQRAAEAKAISDILQAVSKADMASLTQTYQTATDPIIHVWAAMALERVHFNLDAASNDATQCEQALFDNHPAIALVCGQFHVGNLHLAGRHAEADAAERELVQRYGNQPTLRKPLKSMQQYLDAGTTMAPLSYEIPDGDTRIPLKDSAWVPSFTVQANGKSLDAMLDTGASNLVLDTEEAHRLGVRMLPGESRTNGWLSEDIPTDHGVLDELRIGDIVLRNVPVSILPNSMTLIGGNLVAPLGTLRISHQTLLVYGKDSPVPACNEPMLARSGLWGNGLRIIPQLAINGEPQAVLLDTGAYFYLGGSKEALDEVTVLHHGKSTVRDVGGLHAFANADAAKVNIVIGGQPFDVRFVVHTDATGMLTPITLGSGALRDMDFLLDYRHQHQCFLLHPDLR